MFDTISGFSDAAAFRIYNGVPYYYVEGDSYLAKFKTGLCLDDVIDFNIMCDSAGAPSRAKKYTECSTPVKRNREDPSFDASYPQYNGVVSSGNKKTKKEYGNPRFPKKNMQKYRNKLRDEKQNYVENEIGSICSLVQHYSELELYEKQMEIKSYYKKNVMTQIKEKFTIFEWKRKLRLWSSNKPTYYFERNGILYYYYHDYQSGLLHIYGAFMPMYHLAGMYPKPSTLFTELIQQKRYIHVSRDRLSYDIDEIYDEYEDYEFDMAEYYADF